MAFNEQAFRTAALSQGWESADIENEIQRRKVSNSFGVKIAKAMPAAFTTAGTIGGGLLGTIPGAALGGFAGYTGGKAVEDMLLDLLGAKQPQTGKEVTQQIEDVAMGGVKTGAMSAATMATFKLLGKLLQPMKTLGAARESAIGGATTPTQSLEEGALQNLAERTKLATPELQQAAKERLSQFLRETAPLNLTGEGAGATIQQPLETGISQIYKNLTPFEKLASAYEKTSLPAQSTKLASGAVREYLSGEIPRNAQLINELYSRLASLSPLFKGGLSKGAQWGIGGAIASPISYYIGKKLFGGQ